MGRYSKRKYQPKSFESNGSPSDTSSNIFNSMLTSKAWKALTKNQRLLYVYCKAQYYGEKNTERQEYFTMNKSKWCGVYEIYTPGNASSFYKDMGELINKGFIDCVACGADTRTKSIYALSSRWLKFGTDSFSVPVYAKTISLKGSRKKV